MTHPTQKRRKVLLIGWDGADWKTITPLLDAGKMPALESLVSRGVMGNIATLDPPLSPMLWTSIATGKTADKHGVLGFVQPNADNTGVRPVLGTARKTKAVWNILNQKGLRSNVIGWWPSHPAEPLNGVTVSNFYHRLKGPPHKRPPLPAGTIHPTALSQPLADLRVHMQELTGNHLLPFVPNADTLEEHALLGLGQVAKTLAEAATIQAATTFVMEETEWDFMAIYLDAIDHFGHGFMKYRPPLRAGITAESAESFGGVVDAAYRFHDMMLGRLLELVDEETTVMLLSDHGFHSDHLRPTSLPDEPAGPAFEHRDFGIFVMAGPGIKRDARIYGLSLLDVAPTLLTLYGLPIGRDMDGRPALDAFEVPPSIELIDSWDDIEGDDGMHPPNARNDPWADGEAMQQLVELGYVDPEQVRDVGLTVRESQYYLSRVHIHRGQFDEALSLLEAIFDADPEAERYGLRLAYVYRQLGRFQDARATLERTAQARVSKLEHKRNVLGERLKAAAAEGGVKSREAIQTLERKLARTQSRLETEPEGLSYQHALLLIDEGRVDEALAHLDTVSGSIVGTGVQRPTLQLRIGEALLKGMRWDEAEEAFRSVLAIDLERAPAHRGLALSLLRQSRYEEAIDSALSALALQYHYPAAHFHLGEALMKLGDAKRAADAFHVALSQNPAIRLAHVYLSELYRLHLGDPARAQEHTRAAAESFTVRQDG